MGIEYRIVKPATGAAYDLDKAAMREPEKGWEKKLVAVQKKATTPFEKFSATNKVLYPSDTAMWEIGSDNGNCMLSRMDQRWDVESLAKVINIACLQEDDEKRAKTIASDIMNWAGADQVILIPDNMGVGDIEDRIGRKIPDIIIERSIYDL